MYNNRLQKLAPDGTWLATWGSQGTGNGEFSEPGGLELDNAGNIYVVDSRNARIQKLAPDGSWLVSWGSYGSGNGQFNGPKDLALDSVGNIYVADAVNNRIQKLAPDGSWLATWTGGNGQFIGPHGIDVDSAGNIYVSDGGNYRVQKLAPDGSWLVSWGSRGKGSGQFDGIYGVAVDRSGNIIVDDAFNNRVQKFAPAAVLTVTGTGDGIVTGAGVDCTVTKGVPAGDCEQIIATGGQVTLTASTEPGYAFVNWSGQVSDTANPITVTLDTDTTVTANFMKLINLLKNPSFDMDTNGDWRPDNWTLNSRFRRAQAMGPHGVISYVGLFYLPTKGNLTIQQQVTGFGGTLPTNLAGYVKIPTASAGSIFALKVDWMRANKSVIRTDTIKNWTATTSGWVLVNKSLNAPTDATQARVKLVAWNLSGKVLVDEFAFGY